LGLLKFKFVQSFTQIIKKNQVESALNFLKKIMILYVMVLKEKLFVYFIWPAESCIRKRLQLTAIFI